MHMAFPYFFNSELDSDQIVLDEDNSKHITQVLRMKKDAQLLLTNGKGLKITATIVDDHRKRCEIIAGQRETEAPTVPDITLAVSLVKNSSRFEWFLEKATEIGINQIIPLLCSRTEKEKFRWDRMNGILISAMLQSQQCWLPQLHLPTTLEDVLKFQNIENKFIAHCLPRQKQQLTELNITGPSLMLIGPEGDFTPGEIEAALQNNFLPVALGNTRLRTETAGIVAATLLRNLSAA